MEIETMHAQFKADGTPAIYNVESYSNSCGNVTTVTTTETLRYAPFWYKISDVPMLEEKLGKLWNLYQQWDRLTRQRNYSIISAVIGLFLSWEMVGEASITQKYIQEDSKTLEAYKNMLATTQEVMAENFSSYDKQTSTIG